MTAPLRILLALVSAALIGAVEVNLTPSATRVIENRTLSIAVTRASGVGPAPVTLTTGVGGKFGSALTTTITFQPGEVTLPVTLTADDDSIINGERTITISVNPTAGVTRGPSGVITVDLVDDEITVNLVALDVNAAETFGAPGTPLGTEDSNPAVFRVDVTPKSVGDPLTPLVRTGSLRVQVQIEGTAKFEPGALNSDYRLFAQIEGGANIPIAPATGLDAIELDLPATADFATITIWPRDAVDGDGTDASGNNPAPNHHQDWIDNFIQGSRTVVLALPLSSSAYVTGDTPELIAIIADDDNRQNNLAAAGATETGQAGSFTVTFASAFTGRDIPVPYTLEGTAVNGTHYQSLPLTAILPRGQTSVTIPLVPIAQDTVGDTSVTLVLAQSQDYLLSGTVRAETIIRDRQGVVELSAITTSNLEGQPFLGHLRLLRDPGHTDQALVAFALTGTTAADDIETVDSTDVSKMTVVYDAATRTGIATIKASVSEADLRITTRNDGVQETDETVILTISRGETAAVSSDAAKRSVTFTAIDKTPKLAVSAPSSAMERVNDATTIPFTITRSVTTVGALTASYTLGGTLASTARNPAANTGSVTFADGETTKTVPVTILDNLDVNGPRTLSLTLDTTSVPYATGPAEAACTITDDEPTLGLASAAPLARHENDGVRTFVIGYAGTAIGRTVTAYFKLDGTATTPADFTMSGHGGAGLEPGSYQVTIPANATSATITLTPTVEDAVVTGKTIIPSLNVADSPKYYAVGSPSTQTLTIVDGTPEATITAVTNAVEGMAVHCFRVDLSFAPTTPVTINLTRGGSATADDFDAPPTSVTIPAGQASAAVVLTASSSAAVETGETVDYTLIAGTGYTVATPATGTVFIDEALAADAVRVLGESDDPEAPVGGTWTYTARVSLPNSIPAGWTTTTITLDPPDAGVASTTMVSPPEETGTLRQEVAVQLAAAGHVVVRLETSVDVNADGDPTGDPSAVQDILVYAVSGVGGVQ